MTLKNKFVAPIVVFISLCLLVAMFYWRAGHGKLPNGDLGRNQIQEDLTAAGSYVEALPESCTGEVIQDDAGSVSIDTNCAGQRFQIKIQKGRIIEIQYSY